MQICSIDAVVVKDNRQRLEFNPVAMLELNKSIEEHGLFHLPICRREDGKVVLVAGERRLRLLRERHRAGKDTRHGETWIGLGNFLYTDLGELSPIEAFEAELDENIKRTDLTWQETASATGKLHALRSMQAQARGEIQTVTQTAAEVKGKEFVPGLKLGDSAPEVSQNILLSGYLSDPDVASAKTPKEAMKVVQKKAMDQHRAQLAQQFDLEYNPNDPSSSLPHKFLVGDAFNIMQELPDSTYTVLLTDPPYGIGADTFGDQSGQGHAYTDSHEYFERLINVLATESFRFCTPQAHAYCFCDPRRFTELELAFQLAGWKVWPVPIIWVKNQGMLPRPEHGPRRCYETVLFASKGDRKTRVLAPDTIIEPGVRGLLHGAQKPASVFKNLLSRSCDPGDQVVDPFCGSGTIFAAANTLKLKATGVELNEDYVAMAKLRMFRTDDYLNDSEIVDVADSIPMFR